MNRFVIYYFGLVLLIGGIAYAPWVLASYGMFPFDLVFVFVIVGGVSPTVAALVTAKLEFGKGGAEYLFNQFGRKGFPKFWFLAAVFLPLALAACAVLLWSIAGGAYTLDLMKLAEFPPILITSFLMNMWEEVGWRGYALPALQKKYNALISSLIVGAFWALWHWPHFAVKDSVMAVNYHNFLWFVISRFFTPSLIRGFTTPPKEAYLPHRYIMHPQTQQTPYYLLKLILPVPSFLSISWW
ncbi:MAG: type II CAAX endopeptidase family protein [Candidatus Bathyarchaeia archaeon]